MKVTGLTVCSITACRSAFRSSTSRDRFCCCIRSARSSFRTPSFLALCSSIKGLSWIFFALSVSKDHFDKASISLDLLYGGLDAVKFPPHFHHAIYQLHELIPTRLCLLLLLPGNTVQMSLTKLGSFISELCEIHDATHLRPKPRRIRSCQV